MRVERTGAHLRDVFNQVKHEEYTTRYVARTITDGCPVALSEALQPLWDGLDDDVREVALTRLGWCRKS